MHRIAVLATLAASAAAQLLPVTSPKGLDLIEGNTTFNFGNSRRMMGIDNTLRGSVLPITAFGLRRNGGAVTPGAGTMTLEIDLGVADFARMSAEFDKNYVNNSKTVAHVPKVVNYPSWQTPVGTPAPFDFTFTLDQLYLFTGLGAIVWDITYTNLTATGHSIDRDFGTLNSKAGSAFGSGCTSTGMVAPFAHKVTTWNMGAPLGNYGFSLQVSTAYAPAMSPVVMHIDATQQNLTAPGLCAPLLALPLVSMPIGISDGSGTISDTYLQFPYLQALEFGSLVTQELSLDAGQAGIPVSLSNGVVVSFAPGGAGIHQSAYLWATLPATIGTGNFVFIGGSPVAQFK